MAGFLACRLKFLSEPSQPVKNRSVTRINSFFAHGFTRMNTDIIFVFFRVFRGHILLLTVAETAPVFNGIPFYFRTIKLHSIQNRNLLFYKLCQV